MISSAAASSFSWDLALAAPDASLPDLAASARRVTKAAAKPTASALTGAFLASLRETLTKDPMPPAIEAVVLRHAGAVGRQPGLLLEICAAAADDADLERRLVLANTELLRDGSAAVRARAHGWLAARGHAPAGYDPLASPKKRRSALAAAETRAE